jgi:hypothetical protein
MNQADRENRAGELAEAYAASKLKAANDAELERLAGERSLVSEKTMTELSVKRATATPFFWALKTLIKVRRRAVGCRCRRADGCSFAPYSTAINRILISVMNQCCSGLGSCVTWGLQGWIHAFLSRGMSGTLPGAVPFAAQPAGPDVPGPPSR